MRPLAGTAAPTTPLQGIRVLTLAVNVPGPVAAARLRRLGAEVIKIEPPLGDPLARLCPAWYRTLADGQQVLPLDLKVAGDRAQLDPLLAGSDLLLTATRPAALERLGLGWPALRSRHPHLSQVAILGYPAPEEHRAGHDLTYQAAAGLLVPPEMPRTLLADLAAAENVVTAALALLLARERGGAPAYAEVTLAEAATEFTAPLRYGLTTPGSALGGGFAGYRLYRTAGGWLALAALEPHFWERLVTELGLQQGTAEELERVFLTRTAEEWEAWAHARDLPLAAVRPVPAE